MYTRNSVKNLPLFIVQLLQSRVPTGTGKPGKWSLSGNFDRTGKVMDFTQNTGKGLKMIKLINLKSCKNENVYRLFVQKIFRLTPLNIPVIINAVSIKNTLPLDNLHKN